MVTMPARIGIGRCVSGRPGADGVAAESFLIPDRRSKKVGALPDKARMVLAAAQRCLPEGFSAGDGADGRIGVSLGTFYGSIDVAERCLQTARDSGFREVTPSWYATGLPNATAAIIASVHELTGPNLTVMGYQAGIEAIIAGCRQILAGRASAMLAGGFDMVSEYYTARLAEAAEYAGVKAIHPGVGLVWLLPGEEAPAAAPAIVGWSQGTRGEGQSEQDFVSGLVASASKSIQAAGAPVVHLVRPGCRSDADYLAATAPIHLVEDIIGNGPPGLHALVAGSFGRSAACLLIEKPAAGPAAGMSWN